MRILITGGAGFIGSHLAQHYHECAEVVILDNLRSGNLQNLEGLKHRWIEGDITDSAAVKEAISGVDFVFHLAAMISVPESMLKPAECIEINNLGLLNVLEASARERVRKVVFASSAAIYGDNLLVPKSEEMPPEPKSPYAITKLDGEYYLEMYRREGRFDSASLRFFNVFGPRQDPSSAYAAAVPIFIRKALAGEPLVIYGDGEQSRDFVHVRDVVAALSFVTSHSTVNGSYNVGYGRSITVNQLAADIIRLAGSSSRIERAPERLGDIKHSCASVAKLLACGFQHVSSLDQGLTETLAYYNKQASAI